MPLLELQNLSKSYDAPAVQGVSFELETGDILCLLGPSGCGKSTLLRMVAGLETPDTGKVLFGGLDVTNTPPQKRSFGLMFQEFALFPHKSVFDNVAFGLQMQNQSGDRIAGRVEYILGLMGIADLAGRNVANLSGGERQRVALARSLAPEPRLLMLDEPLGSLDRALRERLLDEIRGILNQMNTTAIFVTHDQSEALAIGDRIAVMNAGRLEQISSPTQLYMHPQSRFVAGFLGFRNFIEGRVEKDGYVSTPIGRYKVRADWLKAGQTVNMVLRPDSASLAQSVAGEDYAGFSGRILTRRFAGHSYHISIEAAGGLNLAFDLPNRTPPPQAGEEVRLRFHISGLVALRDES